MKYIFVLLKHLKTVFVHKYWVFYYCCKFGIVWQGIKHDLSKFSLIELKESVKYFQGGKASPIPVAKREQGYSLAWQHHKGRNPHHYEYWTDNYDSGTTYIKIPFKYVLEMIADYLAAGKTYSGRDFTIKDEYDWWNSNKESKFMHNDTKKLISYIFYTLSNYGFEEFGKIKKTVKNSYENNTL